ncbi:MAG: DUF4230 domain-containing protein [Acidimicrobiia bacterium]
MAGRTVEVVPVRRIGFFGKAMAAAFLVVALLVTAGKLGLDFLPGLPDPFATETVDRTQPPLLQSLQDVSRYQAATANFQVIVDTEKDARFMPSILRGERTVYVAAGSVDATVEFSALDERSISVSPDGTSVTVNLPAPTLSEPRIDPGASRVVSRERGLLDRLGSVFSDSPTSDRPYLLAAEAKMTDAAMASDLRTRAETNTRAMLQNMLRALGYEQVTVTFAAPPV